MQKPTMFKAKGDNIDLQLAQWGSGRKTLLCIHGLTANCRCWDRLIPALSGSHRVLGLDLRGRGLSGKPAEGYSLGHHVKDLRALLQDLELQRVTLLGHSLGAYIAVAFAACYPDMVERLILLDGGGQLSQKRWDSIETVIKPSLERLQNVFPSFEAYTQPLKEAPIFQPWTEFHETYFQHDVRKVDQGVRSRIDPAIIQQEIADIRKKDVSVHYRDIACDVLILRATRGFLGQQDLLLPLHTVETMLQSILNARELAVADTNHFSILFDRHTDRDLAIRDFLK